MRHGVKKVIDAVAHQAHGVLRGRCTEHRRGVDDLFGRGVEQPELLGQAQRVLERQALLAVQQKPGAELGERRRVKAAVVDGQAERCLPAQVPFKRLHRRLV